MVLKQLISKYYWRTFRQAYINLKKVVRRYAWNCYSEHTFASTSY